MKTSTRTQNSEGWRLFKLCFAPALGLTLFALFVSLSHSQPPAGHPGNEAYTPTRLEWFALQLQADYGQTFEELGMSVKYVAEVPDTIVIRARYLPQAGVSEEIEGYANLVRVAAKQRGYDWVRVRGDVQMVELNQGIYDGLKPSATQGP